MYVSEGKYVPTQGRAPWIIKTYRVYLPIGKVRTWVIEEKEEVENSIGEVRYLRNQ
jgi:hypothetical protein